MKTILIKGLLVSALLLTTEMYAENSSDLEQKISIYGWLPTFSGTLKFKVPNGITETDSNAIDELDAVFMGSYEIRKDYWLFYTDAIYLKMSGSNAGINTNVNWDLKLTSKLFSFYGGYTVSNTDKMTIDIITGVRYASLGLDAKRSGGSLIGDKRFSPSTNNYDALIGFKGLYNIDESWYIPYQFDIGAGDSDLTWQANASLAYRFNWGDIVLTYRYVHYDKGDSILVKDFDLHGPKLGAIFHF